MSLRWNRTGTALALALCACPTVQGESQPQHNGIVLPDPWPPAVSELSRSPLGEPPYLVTPPAVIPIDVGRQLFVDDFLIESSSLRRSWHLPVYHPANPVLRADQPWEIAARPARAAPFSDGVWYDPADRLFKMWYWTGSFSEKPLRYRTCYATSQDGIHWLKPPLDVVPGTNAVLSDGPDACRNSGSVWLDLDERDSARRFKCFLSMGCEEENPLGKKSMRRFLRAFFSPDGIHWAPAGESDSCGDRSTVCYNAFRKVWIYSLRTGVPSVSRCRAYVESPDPILGLHWGSLANRLWIGADALDPARDDLALRRLPERPWDLIPSQLYNLDCIAYESVLLGSFAIWRGHPLKDRPKINEVCLGFSRDGFHWTRPDRRAFCPVSEKQGDWNWGNVQAAAGGCLIVADRLYFYVGGTNGPSDPVATGLATLRRDGFASLDADASGGILTTRPLRFAGSRLFVNANASRGDLRVEILDASGTPISPFVRDACTPVTTDSTLAPVAWNHAQALDSVAGTPVRFRFHLRNAELYAFWVSPDESGASHGFVAGGGPGFTGNRDTVGRAAFTAAP